MISTERYKKRHENGMITELFMKCTEKRQLVFSTGEIMKKENLKADEWAREMYAELDLIKEFQAVQPDGDASQYREWKKKR